MGKKLKVRIGLDKVILQSETITTRIGLIETCIRKTSDKFDNMTGFPCIATT